MFDLQHRLRNSAEELAVAITREHGKTLPDARGEVQRGLEALEYSCSVSSLAMGETSPNIARNIDCYSFKHPLGVVSGVVPFNFPVMLPLWMIPVAVTCGNTFVLKPSEKVTGSATIIARLIHETGLPKGVRYIKFALYMIETYVDIYFVKRFSIW
jgi:malonate-semialdehyde dehydrogenase (acetylating) / methylmalonate-semialdehyde dehydrogenase